MRYDDIDLHVNPFGLVILVKLVLKPEKFETFFYIDRRSRKLYVVIYVRQTVEIIHRANRGVTIAL